MSITATVENDTIKLPADVHLPDGTQVRVETMAVAASGERGESLGERYAEFIGIADNLPADFAINHDHYLHGARKRA